ncbi:MAG: ParB/RepB/Spo0J family partition protein, partial [Miltoncostaeaceae bacterium]
MPESSARRGLGRGLDALLGAPGASDAPSAHGLRELALDVIEPNPDQPRREIDASALSALAASIRSSGVVQPIAVRAIGDDRYQIIAGERRWRAAGIAGLATIPASVRDADEAGRLELGLVENLAREDLNPMEVALACATLVEDFGRTHGDLAESLGRSRPAVSNLIRLLELPEDVQALVSSSKLTEGHGRAILMADGARARRRLAERVVDEGLNVRQTERAARARQPAARPADPTPHSPLHDDALDRFTHALGAVVAVRARSNGVVVELRF